MVLPISHRGIGISSGDWEIFGYAYAYEDIRCWSALRLTMWFSQSVIADLTASSSLSAIMTFH